MKNAALILKVWGSHLAAEFWRGLSDMLFASCKCCLRKLPSARRSPRHWKSWLDRECCSSECYCLRKLPCNLDFLSLLGFFFQNHCFTVTHLLPFSTGGAAALFVPFLLRAAASRAGTCHNRDSHQSLLHCDKEKPGWEMGVHTLLLFMPWASLAGDFP